MKKVYRSKYGIGIVFKPLLYLLILPFIYGVLQPDKFWDSFVLLEIFALAVISPILYLNYQYFRNDVDQVVEVDSARGIVNISKSGQPNLFKLNEVRSFDYVNVCTFTRTEWKYHAYLRIKTVCETFIVTHFTVNPEELLNQLNVPYENVEVFFPNLDYERLNPKQKKKNQAYFEEKKSEFYNRYSGFSNIELEKIVKDRGRYADYAVAAASEILSSRLINPANHT